MLHFKLGLGIKKEAKYDTPLSASKTCLQEMANNDGGKGKRQMSPCFCCCCLPSILLSLLFLFLCVSAGSPSRGGNVAAYVFDVNQPSLSTPFALFSRPFQSLWPFQLYFIPYILPTPLHFLTVFFWSYSALLVLSIIFSPDVFPCG